MIGKNIQTIRKERNYSLSELATRAQISKSYLSNIERNLNQNPSIQIIDRIAAVLEVDFRTLLGVKAINELHPEDEWIEFSILMSGLIIGASISGKTALLWNLPVIELGAIIATLMFLFMLFAIFRSGRM